MKRFKLIIEYDGTSFSGWQKQPNAITVQECIEKAISCFSKTTPHLFVAGRTDAGVHAEGQVAHVDLDQALDARTIHRATNHFLKELPIAILKVEEVDGGFHARFSAVKRSYRYDVMNRSSKLSLSRDRAWHVPHKLDLSAMEEAAHYFIGHHDFTSFRTVHCQAKSPVRSLSRFDIRKEGPLLSFYVEAPSFLHHQVRNMVGTLIGVGKGRFMPGDIKLMLKAKDRAVAGPTAPPEGLYFVSVTYT